MKTLIVLLTVSLLILSAGAIAGQGADDWPQFRKTADHNAIADGTGGILFPAHMFTHSASTGSMIASPAVIGTPAVDSDGDGPRIFGANHQMNGSGSVFALDSEGNVVWSVSPTGLFDPAGGFSSSPAVGDLNGDGSKSVLIGHLEASRLYQLDAATGATQNTFNMGGASDYLGASPTLVDLTGDGNLEVVFGGSRSGQDGTFLILDHNLNEIYAHTLNAPLWGSALVADLDGDGNKEIAIATGVPDYICLLLGNLQPAKPNPKLGDNQGRLYVFKKDTNGAWGLHWDSPLEGPTMGSPAYGDFTGDGNLELVIGSQGPRGSCLNPINIQTAGYLQLFDSDNGARLATTADPGALVSLSTPLVMDINPGDTSVAIVGSWNGVRTYSYDNGNLPRDSSRYFSLPETDEGAENWVAASPIAADITGDGKQEVIAQTLTILVDEETITDTSTHPGFLFALDQDTFNPVWIDRIENDSGLSGPVAADIDGDGRLELVLGTGLPMFGNTAEVRVYGPANPIIEEIISLPETSSSLEPVTFQAEISHKNGDPSQLDYAWDFGDGNTASDASPVHQYSSSGTYTVTLSVTDPSHDPDQVPAFTASTTIEITNLPPTLALTPVATPDSLQVTLSIDAADPDGTITSWAVDFGDGSAPVTGTGDPPQELMHDYPTGDTYTITAQVTDDEDATTSAQTEITVNRAPAFDALDDPSIEQGGLLEFTVQASDPDGDDVTLSMQEGPADAVFSDQGDGLGSFSWTPTCGATGTHGVEFIASDGDLQTQKALTITVEAGSLSTLSLENLEGAPIGNQTLNADASLHVYARGANEHGCPLGDQSVQWSTTGDLDAVMPGPASNLLFEPTTAQTSGTIKGSATDASGVTAETGTIQVIAGELAQLVITTPEGIEVDEQTLTTDESLMLVAEGYDTHGNPLGIQQATWSTTGTLDPVDADAKELLVFDPVTADTSGTITAGKDEVHTTTGTIDVLVGDPARIVWTSTPTTTDVDTSVLFQAQVQDQHGNPTGDSVSYSIVDGPGSIDPASGEYLPEETGTGTVSIRGASGDLETGSGASQDDATLEIVAGAIATLQIEDAAGDPIDDEALTTDGTLELLARGYDTHGNLRGEENVAWATTGDLDPVPGGPTSQLTFAPTTAGTSGTITATFNTTIGATTGTITVAAGATAKIVWTDAPESTDVDTPVVFQAEAQDNDGNPTGDSISFNLESGPGALNTTSGEFLPATNGTGSVTIRATSGDHSTGIGDSDADAVLQVVAGTLDTLQIESFAGDPIEDVTLTTDDTLELYARGYDAYGNLRGDEIVQWTATLELDALQEDPSTSIEFSPITAGTSGTILADAGNEITAETGTLTVTGGQPEKLVWLQTPESTDVDTPVTVAAHTQDRHGNPLDGTIHYELVSGPGSIDEETGTYTPATDTLGTAVVRATSGGLATGSGASDPDASIEVLAGALSSLVLQSDEGTPIDSLTLSTEDSLTVVAHGWDAYGNPRGNELVTWATTGDLDPVEPGPSDTVLFQPQTDLTQGTITATGDGDITASTGTIQVFNEQPPLPMLTVDPVPVTIGNNVTFDASGSTQPHGTLTRIVLDPGDGSAPYVVDEPAHAVFDHRYTQGGNYTVELSVENDRNETASLVRYVVVLSVQNTATSGWYKTVQEAVDAADEGQTIQLHPGEYEENVHIKTNGLHLKGPKTKDAVFTTNALSTSSQGPMMRVAAANVTIEGLVWHTDNADAIRLTPEANGTIEITGNRFIGEPGNRDTIAIDAAQPAPGATLIVTNNQIQYQDAAIVAGPAQTLQIQGNQIDFASTGIRLTDASQGAAVTDNTLRFIDGNGIWTGTGAGHQLLDNEILSSAGTAIHVAGKEHTITGNRIVGVTTGMQLSAAITAGSTLESNVFLRNDVAIRTEEGLTETLVLRFNDLRDNDMGIHAGNTATVDARYNWWGTPAGPLAGDSIDGDLLQVQFAPWCLQPECPLYVEGLPDTGLPTDAVPLP